MSIRLHLPPDGGRLIYDLRPFGLDEVPYFAAQNLPRATPGLPLHFHRDLMEINHFLKGERVYTVNGEDFHLLGNQTFITFPNEPHGSGYNLHGRGLHFWLQMRVPKVGRPFLGMSGKKATPLLGALHALPRRQFPAGPSQRHIYSRMLEICGMEPSAMAGVELSALLVEWLLQVVSNANGSHDQSMTPDIGRALTLGRNNLGKRMMLEEMAEVACLSVSRFKGKFKEQMGMPPGEYFMRRRLEAAAERLMAGRKSVTDIAYDLAFPSSQHFSTMFRKYFGVSPSAWVESNRKFRERLRKGDSAALGAGKKLRPWIEGGKFHGYLLS